MTALAGQLVCLQCGTTANGTGAVVCRRCGLRFGAEPPRTGKLPTCPVCYETTADDGRIASLTGDGRRLDLLAHMEEHERFPVGDDEWLETLRRGDRILIGRWAAPFDVVRHYLVTGVVEAGRNRTMQHNAIVTAMSQIRRWGADAQIFGDQQEWVEARRAVADLMERYHRRRR
jgi:hypothetical protein